MVNNSTNNSTICYSFIIPHKNTPLLLKRCVDSIPVRTDVQIIVVDDNSDEGKKPQLQREDVEIICLNALQSKGAGRSRNIGLQKAAGNWLLFPDCDDYYASGFLDILDTYKEKDVDVLYFNSEYRDGVSMESLPQLTFQKDFAEYDDSSYSKERIKFHHNVPWTKMVRRDYVIHNNILFEEVVNGNDILFSMLVGFCTNKIEVVKNALYIYLRNSNGLTQKKQTGEELLCIIKHCFQINKFYDYINHEEWKWPIVKKILYYVNYVGLQNLFTSINKLILAYEERNEWVLIMDKHLNSIK